MKNRKAVIALAAALAAAAVFVVLNYEKTICSGTDELIEKARKVIPISNADTADIAYAGMCGRNGKALIWFISGSEYQAHYYLPMEVTPIGQVAYKYERVYKPLERGMDIAVLMWQRGYAFCVNNPKCVTVRIDGESGPVEERIEHGCYPYVFYYSGMPSEYVFLDSDGNEI